jgi:hypothetical protein
MAIRLIYFGCTEVRAKLFVQFELNMTIFLVNLIHFYCLFFELTGLR